MILGAETGTVSGKLGSLVTLLMSSEGGHCFSSLVFTSDPHVQLCINRFLVRCAVSAADVFAHA